MYKKWCEVNNSYKLFVGQEIGFMVLIQSFFGKLRANNLVCFLKYPTKWETSS